MLQKAFQDPSFPGLAGVRAACGAPVLLFFFLRLWMQKSWSGCFNKRSPGPQRVMLQFLVPPFVSARKFFRMQYHIENCSFPHCWTKRAVYGHEETVLSWWWLQVQTDLRKSKDRAIPNLKTFHYVFNFSVAFSLIPQQYLLQFYILTAFTP